MQKLTQLIFGIVLLIFTVASSAGPMHEFDFDNAEQEEVFMRLSHDIRCLVCQNQSIGESNAGLAKDLREEIYGMLIEGKQEQEVVDFLVQRYGDYVLYNPPMKPLTWLLWFGPLLMFFGALFYALRFVRSHQARGETVPDIDNDDLDRLRNLQAEAGQNTDSDNKG